MPLPIPKLDDKTFKELFEEARALIPRYAREWTDHNLSDPGITFIDLFAWLAEMQIYYLDRVTDRNFLKFLKLLGGSPQTATPSTAGLTFELKDPSAPPLTVSRGTQVSATDLRTAERIVYETSEDVLVHSSTLRRVLTSAGGRFVDNTSSNGLVGVPYFAFGEEPGRGDKLYLGFGAGGPFPRGTVRLIVNVFDADLPPAGAGAGDEARAQLVPSAELEWRYWGGGNDWEPLRVVDDTAALTRNGSIAFDGPGDIAAARFPGDEKDARPAFGEELYWLRASVGTPGYEIPPRLDTVAVNTVSATHGKTIRDEFASASGLPFLKVRLRNRPVLDGTVELMIKEGDGNESGEGEGGWREWTEVADFDASGPEDRHFSLNLKDGVLKFGDGIQGHIPPAPADEGGNIHVVKYRAGGGEKGNVVAGAIGEVLAPGLKDAVEVKNPRPSAGGAEAETLDEAKSRARRSLKEVTRGITSSDFETLAAETPGLRVARVKVLPQYHPKFPAIQMPGAVTVVAVPEILRAEDGGLPVPSAGFLKTVYRHLKSRSVVSTNLSVIGPELVEVKVAAVVRADPRVGAETVRARAVGALQQFLNPLTGGEDRAGWPFGRPVYRSEIYQLLGGVAGVVCVERVSLFGRSCDSAQGDRITLRKIGLVYSGEHEIAVC